jgi:hypothetical protein
MPQDAAAAVRLRLALDMFTTGEDLARQRMRREHPDWTGQRIDEQIGVWLRERPGAQNGDAEGRTVEWPSRVE